MPFFNSLLSLRLKRHRSTSSLVPRSEHGIKSNNDIVIALMGPTGSGKSTFINTALGEPLAAVGHTLEPCTRTIVPVTKKNIPELGGSNVTFVDTPGFDVDGIDAEILVMVSDWLRKNYSSKAFLDGIIYFQRITDNRLCHAPFQNHAMFRNLCNEPPSKSIILTTTMWSHTTEDSGQMREEELKSTYWRFMLLMQSKICRFEDTRRSAWDIIVPFNNNHNSGLRHGSRPRAESGPPGTPTSVRQYKEKVPNKTPLDVVQVCSVERVSRSDVVIALVGPTGAGKTSFLNRVGGLDLPVGHGLTLCTTKIRMYRIIIPQYPKTSVVFIDTPGFDENHACEDILQDLILHLQAQDKKHILDGLLYFHRIGDNRMVDRPNEHLENFKKLCGERGLHKLILTTTMWDQEDPIDAKSKENQLRNDKNCWKKMMSYKSTMKRFENTTESALSIVVPLIGAAMKITSK